MFHRLPLTLTTISVFTILMMTGCSMPEPLADLHESLSHHDEELPPWFLERPLTIDDAIHLAAEHNLDARVKAMEEKLASGKADLARFAMLPDVSLRAGQTFRSSASEYRSTDQSTGTTSSSYSTSEDTQNSTADLTMSWNLVSLGLAVLRSGEEDNRVLLAAEKRRRALQVLIQDVRISYWKAVVNETAERRYRDLEQRLRSSVEVAHTAETDQIGDPMQMLTYQRAILETMRQITELQQQTALARTELAGLMGVPPSKPFRLVPLEEDMKLAVDPPANDLDVLERNALANRPETHSDELQFSIDVDDVRAEMLKTLPGIGPFLGGHYDSTSYLMNNIWADMGVRVMYSLNDAITAPTRFRNAKNVAELTRTRRLVTAMAVLTQVHVAEDLYRHAYREYRLTEQLADVDQRISQLSGASHSTGYGSELEEIKAQASSVLSGLRRVERYADLEGAKAKIDAALGKNPWEEDKQDDSKVVMAVSDKHEESEKSKAKEEKSCNWFSSLIDDCPPESSK